MTDRGVTTDGGATAAGVTTDGGATAAGTPDAGPAFAAAAIAEAADRRLAVYDEPGQTAPARVLDAVTPAGGPLVLLVTGATPDGWLRVLLPVRPNGSTGWVRGEAVSLSSGAYRIEVRLAAHTLTVYQGSAAVLREPIGVGHEPTPTPGGRFYLYELLRPPDPTGAYGPFAFGLSGFSDALTDFAGGDGRLGIHGTNDPASIGGDSTHGCIRLANPAIVELAELVPLGTPVLIDA